MTPTTETWLPVVGYEGFYEVSDHGRVRSLDRWTPFKNGRGRQRRSQLLKPASDNVGRYLVSLSRDRQKSTSRVSVLVLAAFVGPRPNGTVGCHNDGDPSNNRLSNLRWDSQSANIRDAVKHGTHSESRKTQCIREHLLSGPNLLPTASRGGRRACRACQRALRAREKAQLRGEPFDVQQVADAQYSRIMRAA